MRPPDPWPQLTSLKKEVFPPKFRFESRSVFGDDGRLLADETKKIVPCPKRTERTAVLLVLGQSSAANYGGQRFQSRHGGQVVNFFEGRCFIAVSPLLGSTGSKGEYWTRLGNLPIDSGRFDEVVIAIMSREPARRIIAPGCGR